jgi:hypothetical protein
LDIYNTRILDIYNTCILNIYNTHILDISITCMDIYSTCYSAIRRYIMWHSQLRIYIPWGAAEGNIHHAAVLSIKTAFNLVKIHLLFCIIPLKKNIGIYYEFSLLHMFSLVLQPWMSAYIRKTDGVYISIPKND